MMSNILFILVFIFLPSVSYSYIDPGLGSILIQSIVGGISVVLVFLSGTSAKIKNLIKKLFKTSNKKK